MNLEEIITAAVEKQLNELLDRAFEGTDYNSVQGEISKRIAAITKEEFAKREIDIRNRIAALVQKVSLSNLEVDCYAKLKESQ